MRSDDIVISGGGRTEVAPDALLTAERDLAALVGLLNDLAGELVFVRSLIRETHAGGMVDSAASRIEAAAVSSRGLAHALRDAADRYGAAERRANDSAAQLSELAGWALGGLAPLAILAAIAALPGVLTSLGVGTLAAGSPRAFLREVGRLAKGNAAVLRDPRMVTLIRLAVSAADDTMLGAAGVPLPLVRLADDSRTGLVGLHGAATGVVAGASLFGAFRETPVHVERSRVESTAPPRSYDDLARRIPPAHPDSPQVRIERYEGAPGHPLYVVYVGGTVDPGAVAGSEPFDLTSDLTGVAGLDPASLRATEQAMQQAGVRPGDTVIPVGYSQGGIVATDLARSGRFDVPALVTFGSPTGGVDIPSSTIDVAVEHTDDLVPALGGVPRAFDNGGGDRIVVSRQTYSGELPSGSSPIAGHLMSEYRITARHMDASTDPRLGSALDALPRGSDGAASLYQGIRG